MIFATAQCHRVAVLTTSDCRSASPVTHHEFGTQLRLVNYDHRDFAMLDVVSRIPGKETDHSRGHWPSEAFVHLVIGARMLEEYGYSHTVYVDADAWPLDDALRFEVPRVDGIGCVAALSAQCLEVELPRGVSSAASRAAKERADEYRLVTDPALRAGVVAYNNEFLKHARWADWMHALVNVSRRGFYGDQTALTVALGRADVPVRWLHPRFNVMVTLPYSYVLSSCGEDALYAGRAARAAGAAPVSIAHFTWGPKPWMKARGASRASSPTTRWHRCRTRRRPGARVSTPDRSA